jgi:hypothetical protein
MKFVITIRLLMIMFNGVFQTLVAVDVNYKIKKLSIII